MDTLNTHKALPKEQLWNRDAALNRLGGNEGLLNRIVEMFLAQITQKQQALQKAATELDVDAVKFTSHAMKGVSGDVGADAIREKASSIENKAKQGDLTEIAQDVEELDSLIEQTLVTMQS
ncbi:Hpt domain-containing protein [Alteromonas sp. BL110]|uniref:Hpt domain-containing protein n=1 Tax=Alteromonas sp. BL110 TaxID=1714845 RepID=UPI000E49F199|nr:Hpt domain-containing protein [Alteromonas sp. BL110]AXT37253.1 Hpt domain-containing protein [Alteromonas sp. BL110]RKM79991.1 Hpt domain-containing protein [Alteromonas sp. BL110]